MVLDYFSSNDLQLNVFSKRTCRSKQPIFVQPIERILPAEIQHIGNERYEVPTS